MSLSLFRSSAADRPRVANHVAERDREAATAPLRVRERSRSEPIAHVLAADVLEGAEEMQSVPADALAAVVQAMELAGRALVLGYDGEAQRLIYYSQRKRIPCRAPSADVATAPASPAAAARAGGVAYENESSERRSTGSVSVAPGEWWSAVLSAPITDGGTLFLQLERRGAVPASYRGATDAELSLPEGEIDAVIALLQGVVAQARQDGVLPVAPEGGSERPVV
jgi:hypothetical protein